MELKLEANTQNKSLNDNLGGKVKNLAKGLNTPLQSMFGGE